MLKDKFFKGKSSCCDCCGKRTIGFRQVQVGSCCMEIEGLDDIFQEYFKKGKTPDDLIQQRIVDFQLTGMEFELYASAGRGQEN